MKTLILAALTATLLSPKIYAESKGGGGGGGICLNGRCQTLAEAGITVHGRNPTNPWVTPFRLVTEVQKIAGTLPFAKNEVAKAAIAEATTFEVVDHIDGQTLYEAKSEYKRVMRESKFQQNGNLEIFAFSDSAAQKTYLLPKFFSLSERQQALILIHEANIRSGVSLAGALEFDGLLLENESSPKGKAPNYLRFIGSLNNVRMALSRGSTENFDNDTFAAIVTYFQQNIGRPLTLGDFREEPFLVNESQGGFAEGQQNMMAGSLEFMGRLALLKSAETIGPKFYSVFAKARMTTWGRYLREPGQTGLMLSPHGWPARDQGFCTGRENNKGFDAYVLVIERNATDPSHSLVLAADCSTHQADGTYLGTYVQVTRMNLGNLRN